MPIAPPDLYRDPIRSSIRQDLLGHILDGRLAPRTRLSPSQLAVEIGGSATPLREALIELARDGFLDNQAGQGFSVRALTPAEALELYTIIWTLEGLAVRIGPPDAGALADLARINARFRRAGDPAAMVKLDAEWHEKLVAGCGNTTLIETLEILRQRVLRYEIAYARYSGRMLQSAKQHGRIVDLIRRGRVRSAIAELERNWRIGPEFIVPWLEGLAAPLERIPPGPRRRSA